MNRRVESTKGLKLGAFLTITILKRALNLTTRVLAENVSTETGKAAFSHATLDGMGQGAVRINVTLTDPADEQTLKVMTATLMRNLWPR